MSAGVTFEPHEWQLEVTPAADMVEVDPTIGYATVGLNIEVSDSNLDAGYKVRMIDEDSGQELGAQYYVFGNPTWTKTASGNGMDHPVRHFRAEVFFPGDDKPFASAEATVYFHNPNFKVDDITLDGVAAMFASPDDLCIVINRLPSTNIDPPSSASDLSKACLELQPRGAGVREIIGRLSVGTVPLALWLLWNQTVDTSTPATPALPAYQPAPPITLPSPWDEAIQAAATRVTALNPDLALSASNIVSLAQQCLWNAAQAFLGASICGDPSTPIFVTGSDVPEATNHDIEAIVSRPSWMKLNYLPSGMQSGSRDWGYGTLECPDKVAGQQCDEYPFWATEQGGANALPTPHLKMIDAAQNMAQGGLYGNFVTNCGLASQSGKQFIVVPAPPVLGIPTQTTLCN